MDFLTKIAINLMPVVQDPSFKKGCYGLAVITIIILTLIIIRSIIRKRKEKDGKVISDKSSPGATFISILFFVSISMGILADITEWNEPGKITVLDSGDVISTPKPYLSVGKKKTAVYDQTKEIASTSKLNIPEPVEMKFQDLGTAETDFKFDLKLPEEPQEILAIHEKYGSQDKLVDEGAKPVITEAIKIGAMLLSSEECPEEKEKKLSEFVKDQLNKGLYLIEKGVLVKDDEGKCKRKKHILSGFKIKFDHFRLENFKKEELVRKIEVEKKKITEELKKIELIKPEGVPFLDDLEELLENKIKIKKDLTKDQKELIITSIKNTKILMIKLKERSEKRQKEKSQKIK
ncbi:MAG: hypothetical protein ABFR36_06060 [Acidobacteriota bacterium]